jgi:tripartite-type tricarboxylate transporter receptor subunit TctC
VVPFPPGGGVDLTARMMQPTLSAALGQPIVIENRGGATGQIGADLVARAAPDGYTLAWTVGTDLATKRFVAKGTFLDPLKDMTPIASALESVSCLAVSAGLPANSLSELIDYARRNPGKLNFGTAGMNSSQHIMGELLRQHGIDLVHVPFNGLGPALVAVMGGEVQVTISNLATVGSAARDGKVKVLAVMRPKRFEGAPQLPAIGEAVPGFAIPVSLWGFFGPPGMPQPIVQRLSTEVAKVVDTPDVRKKAAELSMSIVYGNPEQFAAMIRESMEVYAKVVKAAGIQPQ